MARYADTTTPQGQTERIQQIINWHAAQSKHRGDAHFLLAMSWGEAGDYVPGLDDGTHVDDRDDIIG